MVKTRRHMRLRKRQTGKGFRNFFCTGSSCVNRSAQNAPTPFNANSNSRLLNDVLNNKYNKQLKEYYDEIQRVIANLQSIVQDYTDAKEMGNGSIPEDLLQSFHDNLKRELSTFGIMAEQFRTHLRKAYVGERKIEEDEKMRIIRILNQHAIHRGFQKFIDQIERELRTIQRSIAPYQAMPTPPMTPVVIGGKKLKRTRSHRHRSVKHSK